MTTTKKVKGWAVIGKHDDVYAFEELKVYAKLEKERFLSGIHKDFLHIFNDLKVVPCTITYSLPSPRKTLKKK